MVAYLQLCSASGDLGCDGMRWDVASKTAPGWFEPYIYIFITIILAQLNTKEHDFIL
jgi:hypothetical protein